MAETIIECAGQNNESPVFPPTKERLRGRWSSAAPGVTHTTSHASLQAVHRVAPTIPGIYVALDPQNRVARRFDPLNTTPEGKVLWSQLGPVLKQQHPLLQFGEPWPEVKRERLTDDQVKTWAIEMRNMLDCGLARHVSGPELPDVDKLREMPGARIVTTWMGETKTDQVEAAKQEKHRG